MRLAFNPNSEPRSSLLAFELTVRAWQQDGEAAPTASSALLEYLCDTLHTPIHPACYCLAVQHNVLPAVQWLAERACPTSSLDGTHVDMAIAAGAAEMLDLLLRSTTCADYCTAATLHWATR